MTPLQFYHQALVTVTPAFLSPTSAKPRIATPLLVQNPFLESNTVGGKTPLY